MRAPRGCSTPTRRGCSPTYSVTSGTSFAGSESTDVSVTPSGRRSRTTAAIGLEGDERRIFYLTGDLIRHDVWFNEPFIDPAKNDQYVENLWYKVIKENNLTLISIRGGVLSNV